MSLRARNLDHAVRAVLGFAAPPLRYALRELPEGMAQRSLWRSVGNTLSKGSWRFTAAAEPGFRICGDTVDFIQRCVYYFGVWEPNITAWMKSCLRPGDTFVDVGANIGYYTLLASQLVGPSGRVVAIEASARIFARLQSNLALNHVDNVRAVNVAISDCDGVVELYAGPRSNSGQTTTVPRAEYVLDGTVRAKRLDAVLDPQEIASARIFKVDVEGAEWGVIAGFASALNQTRHDAELIIEITPGHLEALGRTPADVFAIFADADFHAYRIENDYAWESYMPPRVYQRPRRIHEPPSDQADIIFSRTDAATL
jgi:FkbM family methyltransferase